MQRPYQGRALFSDKPADVENNRAALFEVKAGGTLHGSPVRADHFVLHYLILLLFGFFFAYL